MERKHYKERDNNVIVVINARKSESQQRRKLVICEVKTHFPRRFRIYV